MHLLEEIFARWHSVRPSSHDVSIYPSRCELKEDNTRKSISCDTTSWVSYLMSWVTYFYNLEAFYSIFLSRLPIIMTCDIVNLVITLSLNHKMWCMLSHITIHCFEDYTHHTCWSWEFLLRILPTYSRISEKSEFHSQIQDAQVIHTFQIEFSTITRGESVPFSPFYCF